MVSAVFHSPLQAQPRRQGRRARRQAADAAGRRPTRRSRPAAPKPRLRLARPAGCKVLPPIVGLALLIGIWALLTMKSTTFPTPAATFDAAVKLFADPFYRNGPNDQGIGWNILFSLERVAVGFGLAALVGIPLGFMIGRFEVPQPHGLAADQPAAAGVAAGLAADRPAGVQGRQPGRDLDDLHLLDLADDHQHRGRRAARAGRLPERRPGAEPAASGR